ncbi:hypothetical protein [Paenibacillus alba]|uniref:Type III secretion system effector HopBF1-like domain-containing protein n=1 Tax=Paenibacillus alba TaxID=1197127 RepID=A0ABU6FVI4_9BACL|nr:hypothetical protein [Paenibacillus alba]MEC0225750.1 hypothetical protein [Paenibacillus alba]
MIIAKSPTQAGPAAATSLQSQAAVETKEQGVSASISAGMPLSPAMVMQLQRTVGNQAVMQLLRHQSSQSSRTLNKSVISRSASTDGPKLQRSIDKSPDQYMKEQSTDIISDHLLKKYLYQYMWEIAINTDKQTFKQAILEATKRSPDQKANILDTWDQLLSAYHSNDFNGAIGMLNHLIEKTKDAFRLPLPPDDNSNISLTKQRALIVQGAHMRGDMYGVAGALAIRPDMSVVILSDFAHYGTAKMMEGFYQGVIGGKQNVYILHVPNAKKEYNEGFIGNKKNWISTRAAEFETSTEEENKERKFAPMEITSETKLIKDSFDKDTKGSYATIKDKWLGKADIEKEAELQKWLEDKMQMPPGAYALLWMKQGELTHPHAHHYTSEGSQQKLIKDVTKSGRIPVNIGDKMGVTTVPDLTEFWNHPEFPYQNEGRKGQIRMLHYLAHSGQYDVVSVGMRSGILEGPALVGMKVIFMEEEGNDQAARWENLIGTLPNLKRVILDAPPGLAEKKLWIDNILWRNHKSEKLGGMKVIENLETYTGLKHNDIAKILLDCTHLPDAENPLMDMVNAVSKDEIQGKVHSLLEAAFQVMNEEYEQNWKEEMLGVFTAESKEGMKESEVGVLNHLLTSWDKPMVAKDPAAEAEFWKRTRRSNTKEPTFNWEDEKRDQTLERKNKQLQALLEEQDLSLVIKNRDQIAEFRAEKPEFEETALMKEYRDRLNKEIYRLMDLAVESDHKVHLKTLLLEDKVNSQLGTIDYETRRLLSVDREDPEVVFSLIEDPLSILVNVFKYDEAIAKLMMDKTNNNLLASYNLIRLHTKNFPFLDEFKDADISKDPIASGKQKSVFGLIDHDDMVMGIMNRDDSFKMLCGELSILHDIKQIDPKLPMVEIIGITVHGDLPAVIMRRYAEHSKDFVKVKDTDQFKIPKHLNASSIHQIIEMENRMIAAEIRISDLQFLIDERGQVVLADPGGLVTQHAPSKNEEGVIDNLLATNIDKLFRETGVQDQIWVESELAHQISNLTSKQPNDIRVKSIIDILHKKYEYKINLDSSLKYTNLATPKSAKSSQSKTTKAVKKGSTHQNSGASQVPAPKQGRVLSKDEQQIMDVLKTKANTDYLVELPDGYGDSEIIPIFSMNTVQFDIAWKSLKDDRKVSITKKGISLSTKEKKLLTK